MQPPRLPRPDLAALNITYRRIPLLSINNDIYLDSRLIIDTLERRYPSSSLTPQLASDKATATLLRHYTVSAGVFERAAQCMPLDLPLLKDPKFEADRTAFSGRSWGKDAMRKARPEALVNMRDAFAFMEDVVLADGRSWVCGGEKLTMADVEASWVFQWVGSFRDKEVDAVLGKVVFPKVAAWVERFEKAVKEARGRGPKVASVKGKEVLEFVEKVGKEGRAELKVDEKDPLGFKEGEEVEVWPIESGFTHRDRGRLVGLTKEEIVVAKKLESGSEIRIHAPRVGFRVAKAKASKL